MPATRAIDPAARVRWSVAAAVLAFLLADSLVLSSAANAAPPATIEIQALIRDFKQDNEPGGHPDFERTKELEVGGLTAGAVETTLDSDLKPVFAGGTKVDNQWKDSSGREICWRMYSSALGDELGELKPEEPSAFTNAANFSQWYRDVPGVNLSTVINLTLVLQADGTYVYDDKDDPVHGGGGDDDGGFFPIDGQIYGNSPANSSHNYHFTTEIHARFEHDASAGKIFMFTGDDDLWVFINGQLVIELAGTHGETSQFLDLDRLGLADGETYTISIFHAERQTDSSNFRFQTNLILTDALYTASITAPFD